MDDQAIEQQIQAKGKTAPRVTPADLEANIASAHYFTAEQGAAMATADQTGEAAHPQPPALRLLTFCVLILKNGFTVTGESACASPENFDAEIGRNVARQNAVQKIWPLMGYQLRDALHLLAHSQVAERELVVPAEPPAPGAAHAGYSTMAPHQQRVVDEHAELDERVTKLLAFVQTPIFDGLDRAEQDRLLRQADVMAKYLNILRDRIAAF